VPKFLQQPIVAGVGAGDGVGCGVGAGDGASVGHTKSAPVGLPTVIGLEL